MKNKSYIKYGKKYYQNNKKKILNRYKKYYSRNKKKFENYNKIYYQLHRTEFLLKAKTYRQTHKRIQQEYKQNHKEELLQYKKEYNKNRRSFDINFKILSNLRTRIWIVLKKNIKSKTTMKLVGCSIEKLKQRLESQFKLGMSWDNYGKWHIDHIRPCASFDLTKKSEQHKCFNWKNLQPLWAEENLSKGVNYGK